MPVTPERDGYLTGVNAFAVGNAIIELGGGRRALGEKLDLSVGYSEVVPIGTFVGRNVPLATVHAASTARAEQGAALLRRACTIADAKPQARRIVYGRITADL
jgi:thymidine phosphorylase